MFPGSPLVSVTIENVSEGPDVPAFCIEECCRIPDDGVVVFRVEVDNWLLAPHEECGDEPQCGPVRIAPVPRLEDSQWYEFEVETTEPTVAINLLDIAASQVNPRASAG